MQNDGNTKRGGGAKKSMATQPREPLKSREPSEGGIPAFETVEEAAKFWDSHDSTEFEDEFEDVTDVRFVIRRAGPKKAITVRLGQETLDALTKRAQEQGIGLSTLARLWIIERLREQNASRSASKPQS